MKVVNKVISFSIINNSYNELKVKAEKIYLYRPSMLLFKVNNVSVLIFSSLKGRVMGKPNLVEKVIKSLPFEIINIKIQTMTVIHYLNREINLQNLGSLANYEPELFPCAYKKKKNCHINIFHTGKIVITGLKSNMHAINAILFVENLFLNKCL